MEGGVEERSEGRRVLPHSDSEVEPELFQMGQDEDFEGLRPDREVGEQAVEPATTWEDFIVEPNFRPTRTTRGGRGIRGRGRGNRRGGIVGRQNQRPQEQDGIMSSDEDERHEEEPLDGLNKDNVVVGRRRTRSDFEDEVPSNIHPRQHSLSDEDSDDSTSSEEDTSLSESSTTESSSSFSESSEEG